jgi:hypothetical protein
MSEKVVIFMHTWFKTLSNIKVFLFFTFFACLFADQLLTVVLMVKNEEAVIKQTLQPFVEGGADSFLIFDTGSTDNTVETGFNFFKNQDMLVNKFRNR